MVTSLRVRPIGALVTMGGPESGPRLKYLLREHWAGPIRAVQRTDWTGN
jgi:hypothetical protein